MTKKSKATVGRGTSPSAGALALAGSMGADTRRFEYDRGTMDALTAVVDALEANPTRTARELLDDPALMFKAAKAAVERQRASDLEFTKAIKARQEEMRRDREAGEDPAVKAGRTKRLRRTLRDEGQAAEFAALIRGGDTTETARAKMGIGEVKAKRLRAIAVAHKWLQPHQLGARRRTMARKMPGTGIDG